MKNKKSIAAFVLTLAFIFITGLDFDAYGQGRGRGGGRPAGAGQGSGGGIGHGIGNASIHSSGRSDTGLGNASTKSNGRSTAGMDRATLARHNANAMSDNELNRYRGLSRKLGTTPEQMRAAYQSALMLNPNLKYGQFVAANVVADNLGGRFPGITSSAILAGIASGDSLGETLRNLGMTKEQSKVAQQNAEDRIKAAKNRNR